MTGTITTPRSVLLRHYLGARWRFTRLYGQRLQRYQDKLAQSAVRDAMAHSPYYAAHFAGRRFKDWHSLPITDKTRMMTNFTDLNTRGVPLDRAMETALRAERERDFRPLVPDTDLTVGLSSGTSGHRGLFLVSPQERAAWAGAMLARTLPGPLLRPGGWRVAFFHRSGSNLYESLASRALSFRFFDLMTPLIRAVAHLNDLCAASSGRAADSAQPSGAGEAGRASPYLPQKIISVAEVLEPQDGAVISEAFQVPCVHQIYQCTEGLLAVTCSHGRLHLQEDIVAVQTEPLIDDTSPAETRERRVTPIVTDLWRRVQPIIRYRLGDVLALAPDNEPSCPCGSRFRRVVRIEGRCDDVLLFPDSGKLGHLRPFFPDTLRRAVLLADAGIIDYRIVQENPGTLRIHLALLPVGDALAAVAKVRASVLQTLFSYGCSAEHLSVEIGLPDEPLSRKRRRVQRL
jgi:phenylacetate-CoA ligase